MPDLPLSPRVSEWLAWDFNAGNSWLLVHQDFILYIKKHILSIYFLPGNTSQFPPERGLSERPRATVRKGIRSHSGSVSLTLNTRADPCHHVAPLHQSHVALLHQSHVTQLHQSQPNFHILQAQGVSGTYGTQNTS